MGVPFYLILCALHLNIVAGNFRDISQMFLPLRMEKSNIWSINEG